MPSKLTTLDPYQALLNDPFSLQIFDRSLNGSLVVMETNKNSQTILLERRFVNTSEEKMNAGFIFIQCFTENVTDQHLRNFRSLIEEIVKEKSCGNYMDVNPVIIAPNFSDSVLLFIENYNRLQNRQPLETYQY